MRLSFGALAGRKDELLSRMRRACLKRDPGAPIYISRQDLESFETRRDIAGLRQMSSNQTVKYIKNSLEKLLIDGRRRDESMQLAKDSRITLSAAPSEALPSLLRDWALSFYMHPSVQLSLSKADSQCISA